MEVLEDRTLLSTYMVDRLTDLGQGTGLAGDLRYCITNAGNGDSIEIRVTGTINLSSALPNLTHSISIDGPGADELTVRRDTGGNYRIFNIGNAAIVSLSRLTISNGRGVDYGFNGGGIANAGMLTVSSCILSGNGVALGGQGGGIFNSGTLIVNSSTFSGNGLDFTQLYGPTEFGGGIYNSGTLTVTDSTFSGNQASQGGGIDNGGTLTVTGSTLSGNSLYVEIGVPELILYGGGIYNENTGSATVGNSTISGNFVQFWPDRGAGIYNDRGTLTVSNSTIAGNTATSGGGGIYNNGAVNLRNTILAGNAGGSGAPDLSGSLATSGYNLIGNTSGGSGFGTTDLLNVNPVLGSLEDNGGPTQTVALLAGSPALNAGDPGQLGATDQRGVVRSGGVNIGAYQATASALVLNAPDSVTAGTPFTITVQVVDPFGQTAVGYMGTVHFAASNGVTAD
jgi:hypothetical protein